MSVSRYKSSLYIDAILSTIVAMTLKPRAFLSAALLVLTTLGAFRFIEDDFYQKLLAKLDQYQLAFPQEKTYLHLDKPYYATGETLWFKAYVVDAMGHATDTASTLLYVDLVDKVAGKVVANRKIKMEAGHGQGDFALPDSLPAGDYKIRAYTGWMRNFSDDFFFQKDLTIYRPDQRPAAGSMPALDPIDVQFFPEGGNLVAGIGGKVAFKAVSPTGLGVDVEGFVLDQTTKDTIVGFRSQHLGMGYFNFTPEVAHQYVVKMQRPDGPLQDYNLPEVLPQGYSMMVDNIANKLNLKIYVFNNRPADAPGNLTLIAHTRGFVTYSAAIPVANKQALVSIPREKLPEGITHITIFNEQNRPVCERLVYINRNEKLQIELTPDKQTYRTRERTDLTVSVKDAKGAPVVAELSLAATDAGQVIEKNSYGLNIASYLLLTSDLKGHVEQPSFYFDATRADRVVKLDNLLLTQGWRRFLWKDVLQDSLPKTKYFLEQGISIVGRVLKPNQKSAGRVKMTVFMTERDSVQSFVTLETNENGDYGLLNLTLSDTVRVLLQAQSLKGDNRNFTVKLDPFAPPTVTLAKIPYNPVQFDANDLADYLKRVEEYQRIEKQIRNSGEKMLNEVVIKAKKFVEPDARKIYSNPDATIKVDFSNSAGAMNVLQILQGRVAGVQVRGSGNDMSVQIRGASTFSGDIEPLFLVDGMPTSKDYVMSIPVADVDAIEVLKGVKATIFGSQGAGGVIAILTKRANPNFDYSNEPVEGSLNTKIVGFYTPKQFYTPRYDVSVPENSLPDFRSTVFWLPSIRTDADGKAKVSFYNTDAATTVRVRVEGITKGGLPGAGVVVYKVQ